MQSSPTTPKPLDQKSEDFKFHFFSQLLGRKICIGKINHSIGKLADIVFKQAEPYPEGLGLYVEHGWGKPTELIPCDRIVKIEDDAIFIQPPESGDVYPPFVDQPGFILVNEHLMGRTILDMDGRRVQVVNDVQILESKGRMCIVHVDFSINGILRGWGLSRFCFGKDEFISWKYVQPLSVEDAKTTDTVSLSITRKKINELPPEDLADALEELSGHAQQAMFSALDAETAAETLMEAEPRAQRQLIANLRHEKAKNILSEISIPQLADLFSVLPHDEILKLMNLLTKEQAEQVQKILSDREVSAQMLMSSEFIAVSGEITVGGILQKIRASAYDRDIVSYVYIVNDGNTLLGVVDIREIVLAQDHVMLKDIMTSPVVTVEKDDMREDLADLFAKYLFRLLPVVDEHDHLLGVIKYHDILSGIITRAKI